MRISSKGEYGMRALLDLAQHYSDTPIQSHDIHRRQGVDENYLNQILIQLRRAGLIESIRGPQGGHRLARPPAQISLLEAVSALEGPLLPPDSCRDTPTTADPLDSAAVRAVWQGMRTVLEQHLQQMSLDDLVQSKRQHAGNAMYYI